MLVLTSDKGYMEFNDVIKREIEQNEAADEPVELKPVTR